MMQQRVQCPVGAGARGSHPCALPRVWFGSRGSDHPPGHPGDGTAELGLREGPGLSALGQQGPRARNPSRTRPRWRLTLDQCWAVNLALLEPWGAETHVFGEPMGAGYSPDSQGRPTAWLSRGCGIYRGCSLSRQGSRSGQEKQRTRGSLEPRPPVPQGAGCAAGHRRALLLVGRPASRCSRPPWDEGKTPAPGLPWWLRW